MKVFSYCEKILALYEEHKERGAEVCDTTLIPDYFDVVATSHTASKIEDIINLMLRGYRL